MNLTPDVNDLLKEALDCHQGGDHAKARILYQQVLERAPDHTDALHLFGLLHYEEDDYEPAREWMEKALLMNDSDPFYCNNYGLVLEALGRFDESIYYFQRALSRDPNFLDAYINLGGLYQRKRNFWKSLRIYHRALRRFPRCADLYNNMGSLYRETGKIEKSRVSFEQALMCEPGHLESLTNLAFHYQEKGQFQYAISFFLRALEYKPDLVLALVGVATCLAVQGRAEPAYEMYQKALAVDPTSRSAADGSKIMKELFQFPEAIRNIQRECLEASASKNSDAWDIVMVSFCPLGVLGGGQNPAQIARELYQMGNRMIYIQRSNPFTTDDAFHVHQDSFIPQQFEPTDFQIRQYHQLLSAFTNPNNPNRLVVFSIFSPYLVGMLDVFRQWGYQTAYWCLDDYEEFKDANLSSAKEAQLAKEVDILFATSRPLVEKLTRLTGKPCHLVQNGFGLDNFPQRLEKPPVPADFHRGAEKTFVYWGNVYSPWIDYGFLDLVAASHPEWTFNMIGNDFMHDDRVELPNVHYLNIKPVSELYAYGCHADIGFIHFLDNQLIKAVNPIKAYEYLACGIPVISTPMSELDDFPYTIQVRTLAEFEAAVYQLECETLDQSVIDAYLKDCSWRARAQSFLELNIQQQSAPEASISV